MIAVILAGGKGSRLGLKDIPKPMAELAGIPIIERQIRTAQRYGVDKFYILSGYKAEVISDYLGDGSKFGVSIEHIVEETPLGTAGAVSVLRDVIREDFLVIYGDVYFDLDIKALCDFHRQKQGVATLVSHPNDHPYDSDLIETASDDSVISFLSKPHNPNIAYYNNVNAALYVLSPEVFSYISYMKFSDFGKDVFPAILENNVKIYTYSTYEYLKDMGTPERMAEVTRDIELGVPVRRNRTNLQKAIFLDRDGVINQFVDNLSEVDDFKLIAGVSEAIKRINKSSYLAVVVTNQPMIAKGFLTERGFEQITKQMHTLLGRDNAYIDAQYYCPHHPHKGYENEVPELKIECSCRKPEPGMLLRAAEDMNIDLAASWMVGDHQRDISAGERAGCKTAFVRSPAQPEGLESENTPIFDDLYSFVEYLLKEEKEELV